MRTGRPRSHVMLSTDERHRLDGLARRSRSAPELARRARVILACAGDQPTTTIAKRLRVSATTVCKWKIRFLRDRLDGLYDEPRPGTPRKIGDEKIQALIIRTLEATPRGATHWSLREYGQSEWHEPLDGRWDLAAFGCSRIAARRSSCRTIRCDEKVRDIVGLYINPPEHAVVLCVDEKAQIQALDRTQTLLPMRPGQAERRTPITSGTAPRRCSPR